MIDIKKNFTIIKKTWESYIDFLEIKDFLAAIEQLRIIKHNITLLLFYVNQSCFDANPDNDIFTKININPQIIDIIDENINALYVINSVQEKDDRIDEMFPWDETGDDVFPTGVIALIFDAIDIMKQIKALGVMLSVYLLYMSQDTSEKEKNYSLALLEIYRTVLYYGKIEKIIYQTGKLTNTPNARTSSDCTTRLQYIFTLHNNDKYILRIDMPHKGQPHIHINLNESIVENGCARMTSTAFPFSDNSSVAEKISFLGDDMTNLFFRQEHIIWFRTGFLNLINKFVSEESSRILLRQIYEERCHYDKPWKDLNLDECIVQQFLDKQRGILEDMELDSFFEMYLAKSDCETLEILGKLRWIDDYIRTIFDELTLKKEYLNMGHIELKQLLWLIFDSTKDHTIMWQGRTLSEETFISTDLLQICKWIMSV